VSDDLIKIEHDLPKVQKALARLLQKVGNIRPALKAMGETLISSTEQRFDSQTGPDGKKWQDVKPATRKRKKHSKILTEQGHLRGDIHPAFPDDHTLLVGTNSPYGAIHQLGGEIKQEGMTLHLKGTGRNTRFAKKGEHDRTKKVDRTIKIPARPFLGVSKQDEADLLEDVGKYLLGP
jgi:phage virion morphogenesis protein